MPDFAIVDSHVHLYDPTWLRYGWLAKVPKINRRFDLSDFDRCRAEVQVDQDRVRRGGRRCRTAFRRSGLGPGALPTRTRGWPG